MVRIAQPLVTKADESPAYWQIGNLWQIMATGVQTDNAFTLLDQVVHSGGGGGPITHAHTQDEGLYVISGQCTFNAGGKHGLVAPAGTFVCVPGKTEHSFTVDAPDTHLLNFYLPAGFEQLLIGIAHPARERKPQPPDTVRAMLPPPWLADKLSEQYGQTSVLGNPFVGGPDPLKMATRPTPGATLFPYILNASEAPAYVGMGGVWKILTDTERTGGCYALLEGRLRKGLAVTPRVYKERDEMFYVFEGQMTLQLGAQTATVAKGDFVFIPSGTVFSLRVDWDEAHFLNWHTRSGFEKLVKLVCVESKQDATPSTVATHQAVDSSVKDRVLRDIGLTELSVMAAPL